jgi:hypothetical protein
VEPCPDLKALQKRLFVGRVQRIAIRPNVFTWSLFPMLWTMSWFKARPDVYLWEQIRRLDRLPTAYTQRYSNVQAAIGLEGLAHLDEWTAAAQENAAAMTELLNEAPGIQLPFVPPDRTHVFYQYCAYVPDRDRLVRSCIRRGLDIETLHADVCTQLPLFGPRPAAPGAERAARAVQIPVYGSLKPSELDSVGATVRKALVHESDRAARHRPAVSPGNIHPRRS